MSPLGQQAIHVTVASVKHTERVMRLADQCTCDLRQLRLGVHAAGCPVTAQLWPAEPTYPPHARDVVEPDIDRAVARGDVQRLAAWLRETRRVLLGITAKPWG